MSLSCQISSMRKFSSLVMAESEGELVDKDCRGLATEEEELLPFDIAGGAMLEPATRGL